MCSKTPAWSCMVFNGEVQVLPRNPQTLFLALKSQNGMPESRLVNITRKRNAAKHHVRVMFCSIHQFSNVKICTSPKVLDLLLSLHSHPAHLVVARSYQVAIVSVLTQEALSITATTDALLLDTTLTTEEDHVHGQGQTLQFITGEENLCAVEGRVGTCLQLVSVRAKTNVVHTLWARNDSVKVHVVWLASHHSCLPYIELGSKITFSADESRDQNFVTHLATQRCPVENYPVCCQLQKG